MTTGQGPWLEGTCGSGRGYRGHRQSCRNRGQGRRRVGGPDSSRRKRAKQERRPVGNIPSRRKKNHSASRTFIIEVNGIHAPHLSPGAGSCSRNPGRPAGDGERRWGGPIQALPGRGRGGEVEPGEDKGTSDAVPSPLPEGAAPGSQDTRRAAGYVVRMRFHMGFTQARGQLGNGAYLVARVNNGRLRWLPSLPPGATPGSQWCWVPAKVNPSPTSGRNI